MALCSPVFTSYKHFTKRWEWNERIKLPVKYSDLPRTARLAVTIYDCCGAGGGGADTRRQVWTLTIKLSNIREVILVKKYFICLEGKSEQRQIPRLLLIGEASFSTVPSSNLISLVHGPV